LRAEAIALDSPAWQLETTTRQMAMLAFVQDVNAGEGTEACPTLAKLVADSPEALRAITAGKIGLAPSAAASALRCSISACSPAWRSWM
jgi:hypothetical protein